MALVAAKADRDRKDINMSYLYRFYVMLTE